MIEREARKHYPTDDILYSALRNAFMQGAEWADRHPASPWRSRENEPPKVKQPCVFMRADTGYARVGTLYATPEIEQYAWYFPLPKRPNQE